MSVQTLATVIADAINIARNKNGKAQKGTYSHGFVTVEEGTLPAIKAVPVNLYEGKIVWVQVTEDKNAVIIGE